MNRAAAIEAAATALQRIARDAHPHVAATVAVDAAAPHLVGKVVGYGFTVDGWATVQRTDTLADARVRASEHEWRYVVALVPIEDQP